VCKDEFVDLIGMAKALFYIEGKHVQHVGCRLVITRHLIHVGFTHGGAFNMPDGRLEVVMEGEDEQIKAAHKEISENLVSWLERDADDREKVKKLIGNPGIHVGELEFKDNLLVLDIGLFSHSLTFDQIYKGIDVYAHLVNVIDKLNTTLDKKLDK